MNIKNIFLLLIALSFFAVSCDKRTQAKNDYSSENNTETYAKNEIYPWLYSIEEIGNNVFCYLLIGSEKALLFDTTYGYGSLHRVIREITDLPVTVILGHGHFDHTGGAEQLFAYLHSDIWLNEDDFDLYRYNTQETRLLKKLNIGQEFDLGDLNIKVIGMEGHTAGSIGILVKEHRVLLTSDSANPHIWLFLNESLSINQYIAMLERVIQLDFDTFFIGHSDAPMNKSDFQRFIKAARNVSIEKSEPYDNYDSVFIYEEDGANVYFRDTSGKRPTPQEIDNNLPPGDLGAFEITMKDNFYYGNGYQAYIRERNLLNGYRLKKGDTYLLKVTYTASRDLENDLLVGFVDTEGGKWITLSYTQKDIEPPNVVLGRASKAGEEISSEAVITIVKSARTSNMRGNTLVLETLGQGKHRSFNSGIQGEVTISFSKFVLTKIK